MKKLIAPGLIVFIAIHAQAKVWRINNTPGVLAGFTSSAAIMAIGSYLLKITYKNKSKVYQFIKQ